MTSAYLPQNYPLFVASGRLRLPSNIGELDPTGAKYAAFRAVKDQLHILRVVAWLIEDNPGENITAKPVTMYGLGLRSTLAENPDDVRTLWTRDHMNIATGAIDHLAMQKGKPS